MVHGIQQGEHQREHEQNLSPYEYRLLQEQEGDMTFPSESFMYKSREGQVCILHLEITALKCHFIEQLNIIVQLKRETANHRRAISLK